MPDTVQRRATMCVAGMTLVFACLTACGSTTETSPTAPPDTGTATEPGGNGGGGDSGGIAVGSPLRIPLPTDRLQGRAYESGLADLRAGIAAACGGDQCVTVQKKGESTELEEGATCDTILFVEGAEADPATSDPYVDTTAGGTVTIVVNVRCEDAPSPVEPSEESSPTAPPADESPDTGSTVRSDAQ
ncbi:hypothetical protein ACIGCK_13375 [Microbacterium sp. NPDC078428]|uniref:hypothetical protein n=1 Tax=Microbacterium sp. NPDC078428 TaxID=3364190 RepID=UPI0037C99301